MAVDSRFLALVSVNLAFLEECSCSKGRAQIWRGWRLRFTITLHTRNAHARDVGPACHSMHSMRSAQTEAAKSSGLYSFTAWPWCFFCFCFYVLQLFNGSRALGEEPAHMSIPVGGNATGKERLYDAKVLHLATFTLVKYHKHMQSIFVFLFPASNALLSFCSRGSVVVETHKVLLHVRAVIGGESPLRRRTHIHTVEGRVAR